MITVWFQTMLITRKRFGQNYGERKKKFGDSKTCFFPRAILPISHPGGYLDKPINYYS